MANPIILLPPVKAKKREKKGNKHATNSRRRDRKRLHSHREGYTPEPGKCGSSFCNQKTGCNPWKQMVD